MLLDRLNDAPEDIRQLVSDWPLGLLMAPPPGSTVVVVGAYQGKVMDLMLRLQPEMGRIIGYEPQVWAAKRAQARLAGRRNAEVLEIGLGTKNGHLKMGEYGTDAASFVNVGSGAREHGEGVLIEADSSLTVALSGDEAWSLENFPFPISREKLRIDLMIMNIEGYEFTLLPYLRKTGWLHRIDRLAVQWHLNLPGGYDQGGMDDQIALLAYDGFRLTADQRPAWTYHTR